MDKHQQMIVDAVRRQLTPAANSLVDDLTAGSVSRRGFLRQGAVLGLSASLLATVGGAFGMNAVSTSPARAATGGTIRVASSAPTAAIDPVKVADLGGQVMLQQTAEYLAVSTADLGLRPVLAESWEPNETGTVWTFKLRRGVKFHNGAEMKANDVVASIDRLADPANSSNALSIFSGVLSKGGTIKVDDYTVAFHLDAPVGSFPYLVSSDNYNAIILPADYAGDFEKTFVGTGPFKLERYTQKAGATFVRNEDYWGPKAPLDRAEFVFFADMAPQILALQAKDVDVIAELPVLQGVPLLNDPSITLISLKSAATAQVHMRNDTPPFTDKRVRQAIALCIDRNALVQGLFRGRAALGNDSPFAPIYPTTDKSVPQRQRDVAKAKQLLEAAGFPSGSQLKLTVEGFLEMPAYAQLIQQAVRDAGVEIELNVLDQNTYYGDAVFGNSNWLDCSFGMTGYGHRGVPNVLLSAPLKSNGAWNAARFKNKTYDGLVDQYVAALDLQTQRSAAKDIQNLLLDETPILFGYFYDFLTATQTNVRGVETTALGAIFLGHASLA